MMKTKILAYSSLSLLIVACSTHKGIQELSSMEHQVQPLVEEPIQLVEAPNQIIKEVAIRKSQPSRAVPPRKLSDRSIVTGNSFDFRGAEHQQPSVNTEQYQTLETNSIKSTQIEPVSTFSIDVDTGSYTNVRRYLKRNGHLPPVNAVRVEEMINYFNYDYPNSKNSHPFSLNTEIVSSPWKTDAQLIRIGIKANDIEMKELPPANLVFLVDVSGSMNSDDKLGLVKTTLRILTEQLRPQDTVTIVTYASGEKVALQPTSGKNKDQILKVINSLYASGATSGQRAIELAYEQAEKAFKKNGINRIIIATDGDFNVGITNFDALKGIVAEKRKTGISFTSLGFGTGNYNEKLMEQLADAGDGNYSYIDNENEAKKVVQRQLSSTLATIAKDVKIQVEFNPMTVKEYRLVGYENRILKKEDFNNDKVDAGDIGAGHTVTALYEVIPTGRKGWLEESRYQNTNNLVDKSNEYGYLKLRYKLPSSSESILITEPLLISNKALNKASSDTQWAVAVASYGQLLSNSQYTGNMKWSDVLNLANRNKQPDPYGMKSEFIELVKIAESLSSKSIE